MEDYDEWVKSLREIEKREELDKLVRPAKIRLIPGTVFRQNKPAIVGIEVLEGVVRPKYELLNQNAVLVGTIRGLQDKGENLPLADKGREIAAAIDGPTIGRQIKEGEILFSDVPEKDAKLLLKKYRDELSQGEIEVIEELKVMKRRTNPLWGM